MELPDVRTDDAQLIKPAKFIHTLHTSDPSNYGIHSTAVPHHERMQRYVDE